MEAEDNEEVERDQWASPTEFLLSCISMSVGIGNFYRFPFTAYENGGGAFLIPYIIVLLLIGKPIYFLELAIGQFSSYGQVKCWKMAPFFKGRTIFKIRFTSKHIADSVLHYVKICMFGLEINYT